MFLLCGPWLLTWKLQPICLILRPSRHCIDFASLCWAYCLLIFFYVYNFSDSWMGIILFCRFFFMYLRSLDASCKMQNIVSAINVILDIVCSISPKFLHAKHDPTNLLYIELNWMFRTFGYYTHHWRVGIHVQHNMHEQVITITYFDTSEKCHKCWLH